MPVNILMVVDLPAPLGPINATISPLSTENDTLLTALIVLYVGLKRDLIDPFKPLPLTLLLKVFDRFFTSITLI